MFCPQLQRNRQIVSDFFVKPAKHIAFFLKICYDKWQIKKGGC